MKKKLIAILMTLFVATVFFTFYILLKQENTKLIEKTNNLIALQRLTDVSDIVQKEINKSFEYAEFLDLMVRMDSEKVVDNFNIYGALILERNPNICNIQLAPNAIVQYIYPIGGNESAIGHNLLSDPERSSFIKRAIEEKIAISQGPVESLQGTILVFNRKAIYINGKLWGIAIVTIDFNQMMEECGIVEQGEYFSYAIRAKQVEGSTDFVWGNKEIFAKDSIKKDIQLSGQTWKIAIYPNAGWSNTWSSLNVYDYFAIITILVITLLSYFHIFNYMMKGEKAKLDSLTQTLNVAAFQKFARTKIKQKNRKHALIIMDLNDFKSINDNYGHPIGDAVIIEVSKRLNKVIRSNDRLSRMGGDEYLIFLSSVDSEELVKKIAGRIIVSIQEPFTFEGVIIKTGISVGYSLYPRDGKKYEELYNIADEKMYNCKQKSKDNIPCYEDIPEQK